ncbi:hypothetical protein ID866_5516 [Astraeus odoratus]|nr:hypothetical protein ID866_5516 [Astraeus odoratus]
MPSASLQSRIKAFEALAGSSSSSSSPPTKPAIADPPSAASRKSRHVGTTDLLETPISPSAGTFHPIVPLAATLSSSRRSPSLCRKTSLIDLKDWVVEDGPFSGSSTLRQTPGSSRPPPSGQLDPSRDNRDPSTPLINLESPPKQRPPLPLRKPSHVSASGTPVTHLSLAGGDAGATLRPPKPVSSLTVEHTYPPAAHQFGAARVGHAPASSISSFHSISLSSDGSNLETPNLCTSPLLDTRSITDVDSASISDSFEDVSVPSAASPSTAAHFNLDLAMGESRAPPRLVTQVVKVAPTPPPKPPVRPTNAASSSATAPVKARRPPPPPPPSLLRSRPLSSRASLTSTSASTSDRSSILSTATTNSTRSSTVASNTKLSLLHRPTPVPPSARARYDALFMSAVEGQREAERQSRTNTIYSPTTQSRKERQAAGWRGLSLDLVAQSEDHPILSMNKRELQSTGNSDGEDELLGVGERLNGHIVKYIWKASRLDRKKIRDIWNECDPRRTGSLDRDGFVQGMWRIDEELRRAELARCTSALSAASSQRIPHRPFPRNSSISRLVP